MPGHKLVTYRTPFILAAGITILSIGIVLSRSIADPTPSPTATVTPAPTSTPWVPWYKNPDALSITLSTDKPKYTLGDDVLVKIQETNTSNTPIEFFLGKALGAYDLYMSHGTSMMRPLPLGLRSGCVWLVTRTQPPWALSPQATATEPGCPGDYTSIGDWGLKITGPGKYYLVAVRLLYDPSTRSFLNDVQLSNTVEITVSR